MQLDKILERNTHVRRYEPASKEVILKEEVTNSKYTGMSYQDQFVLDLSVRVSYWANQAQYRTARIIAERALIKALYEDELRYLDEAVHAMYNRDMDLAVALLSKLRLSITGDRD